MIFNEIDPKSRKIDKNRYIYIKSLTSIPFGEPIGVHGVFCVGESCFLHEISLQLVEAWYFCRTYGDTESTAEVSWMGCTSRPPKGDRSEGFYIKISIFLDF